MNHKLKLQRRAGGLGVVGSQAKAARAGDGCVFLVWRRDGEKGSPLPYALTFAICLGFFLFGLNVGVTTPLSTHGKALHFVFFFNFIDSGVWKDGLL